MVHAKNYGTMSKFVKVMPTIISPANTAYMYEWNVVQSNI